MSFSETDEYLSKSVRVTNLPNDYDKDSILDNLKNAGTIINVKAGPNTIIVTYRTVSEKDLSKMYEGCPVGSNYIMRLQDADSWEVAPAPVTEEKKVEKVEEQKIPPKTDSSSFDKPSEERPSIDNDRSSLPSKITENLDISGNMDSTDVVAASKKMAESSIADSAELLKLLQKTNVPAKLSPPKDDPFNSVFQTHYVVLFTVAWATWLFISAVF